MCFKKIPPGLWFPSYFTWLSYYLNDSNSVAIAGAVVGNFSLLQFKAQAVWWGPTENFASCRCTVCSEQPFLWAARACGLNCVTRAFNYSKMSV